MDKTSSMKKKLRSKVKTNVTTISKSPIQKRQKTQRSSCKQDHTKNGSRKALVTALSEMGIITPPSIKIDVLRCLYDANVHVNQNKHDSFISMSATRNTVQDKSAELINRATVHEAEKERGKQMESGHYNDIDDSDEDFQDEIKTNRQIVNQKEESGRTFTLFSEPMAAEYLMYGDGRIAERGENDLEAVPKGLRKAIIEGYNVNLARLLLPRDTKKYSRDDDEDQDNSVYLKPKSDPRLDKNLTILEFILAFTRYINIICDAFSHRRRELTTYMTDIIRLSARFGHSFFYDYHRLFAQKAEALLQTRNVLIDWSKRDQDIYFSVFSGLRPVVCDLCRSPDHFTHFCKTILDKADLLERLLSNNPIRGGDVAVAPAFSLRQSGNEDNKQDLRPTCKFFNGAGFGKCIQPNCRFSHQCSRCRGTHPKKLCAQKY